MSESVMVSITALMLVKGKNMAKKPEHISKIIVHPTIPT